MSISKNTLDPASLKSATFTSTRSTSADGNPFNLRHELVDAQVEVLRMYLEKKSKEHFLDALDRLIACTHASFRQEEQLMACLSSIADPVHREMHNVVLAQLELLRSCVLDADRGRLLAQLILVDRQLTSHISDAVQAPLLRSLARQSESGSFAALESNPLAHH
ncbi:MAG: hypothetical protein NDI67_03715 [Sulfuritalea sp.]|nr:hypothetical protein [Sulfuritalea sp.]